MSKIFTTRYEIPVKSGEKVPLNVFGRNIRFHSVPTNFRAQINDVGAPFSIHSTLTIANCPEDILRLMLFNDSLIDGVVRFDVSEASVSDNVQMSQIVGSVPTVPALGMASRQVNTFTAGQVVNLSPTDFYNAIICNVGSVPVYVDVRGQLTAGKMAIGESLQILPQEKIEIPTLNGFSIGSALDGGKSLIIFVKKYL